MFFTGLFSGFFAAVCQSGGYILSRLYLKKYGNPVNLMILAQILIALFSIPLLIFVWKDSFWGNFHWLLPLFLSALGTTGGELMFFKAEKQIEASRLSSLMGLRVVVLAVASYLLHIETYSLIQMVGILLAAASAGVINYQNGKFVFCGMGYMAGALGFYCMSDLSIKFLIDGIDAGTLWRSSLIAASLVNLLIGGALLPFFFLRRIPLQDCKAGSPYAVVWFAKQVGLYFCYAAVGPVFGNVIMSSRGPLAILLTLILLYFGVENLEGKTDFSLWLRRGIATLMMVGAIALYSLG